MPLPDYYCLFILLTRSSADAVGPHDAPQQHPFNGCLSGATYVNWYQRGKTNLDFTEARISGISTPLLSFLQARCRSYRPTNSVKALKAHDTPQILEKNPPEKACNIKRMTFKDTQGHLSCCCWIGRISLHVGGLLLQHLNLAPFQRY